MDKRITVSKLLQTFQRYYKAINNKTLKVSLNKIKIVENFVNIYHKKYGNSLIGEQFINEYVKFQFDYWKNQKLKYKNRSIQLEWVFGKKAFERWLKEENWKIEKRLQNSDINVTKQQKYKTFNFVNLIESEEQEKQRFYNKKHGFEYCKLFTTLYNPKSEWCKKCLYKRKCKNLLKNEYKNVYRARMQKN